MTRSAALGPLTGHVKWTRAVEVSPDGSLLATAGEEWHRLRLFDLPSGKPHPVFTAPGAGTIRALDFSPDGRTVATAGNLHSAAGGRGGCLMLWDVTSGKGRNPFPNQPSAFVDLRFRPGGKELAAVNMNGALRIYDLTAGKERLALTAHPNAYAVRYTPDGKRLVTGGGRYDGARPHTRPGEVKVWDAESGKLLAEMKGHTAEVIQVAVRRDGKRFASVGCDGTLRVWDADAYRELWRVQADPRVACCVAFLPDGRTVASGGMDGRVRLWDVETGKERLWP